MDLVQGIAEFSTAQSMAELRMAVQTRTLKMAQDQQGQVVQDLLSATMEGMEEMLEELTSDLGSNLDTLA
jgi:hypothetical protein